MGVKWLGNPAALQNAEQCCGKYPVFFAGKGVDLWRGGWGCGDRAFITGMAKFYVILLLTAGRCVFLGCNLFGLYGYTLGEIYGRMAIWILILREVRYF